MAPQDPATIARRIHAAGVERSRPSVSSFPWTDLVTRAASGPVRIAAVGKAGIAFAVALEQALGPDHVTGLAVVPHGYRLNRPSGLDLPAAIEVLEGGHPTPDTAGLLAARRVLALADGARAGESFVAAISGGGSALLPALPDSISLVEAGQVGRLLMAAGAPIDDLNTVRRAISRLAGGRLAARAAPADVVGLYLSDVPGDDPAVIAGGPTVAGMTTASDALEVLDRYRLLGSAPRSVVAFLEQGGLEPTMDCAARNHVVGTNRDALNGAEDEARRSGHEPTVIDTRMTGEARQVARSVIRTARTCCGSGPRCLLWAGETTVTVRGPGRGGRNQELALAAALELDRDVSGIEVILAAGTDGQDGPTVASGAWATTATAEKGRSRGNDPGDALSRNDSHGFFEKMDELYVTGPTHTNVMDLVVVLVR